MTSRKMGWILRWGEWGFGEMSRRGVLSYRLGAEGLAWLQGALSHGQTFGV